METGRGVGGVGGGVGRGCSEGGRGAAFKVVSLGEELS